MKPPFASLALAALVLAGCGGGSETLATRPPPAVETASVTAADGAQGGLIAAGTLERRREITLSFRIAGVITRLNVDAGDTVAAGQLLATLDPAAVDARQIQAEAEVERARRDLQRDQTLFDQGYVSRQRLDDRRSALKAAQAAYDAAAFDRRWARLTSPAGGVVLERTAQSGEVVQPGQAVLRIADLNSPLVLRVPLADRDVARVIVGQSVEVRFDALPGQIVTGRIVKVGQAADVRTGAVVVEVELPGRPALRSGLTATARFAGRGGGADGAVLAPAEAILEADGEKAFVMRLDGDRVRRTPVRFLGFDGDFARISGLPPGARVVTAGAGFVSDGEKVSVADAAALAGAVR